MPKINVRKFSRSVVDTIPEEVSEIEQEPSVENFDGFDNSNNENNIDNDGVDMFADLTNENYVSEEVDVKVAKNEKERLKMEKEQLKLEIAKQKEEERRRKVELKELEKMNKITKSKPQVKLVNDDELFSNCPDELMGLDKRQLLKKISEYRSLFPKQLKSFKIKKNPSIEDLQQVLQEFDAIVSTDSVEGFALEAIMSCIGIAENISAKTKWNITGTAQLLNENEKFKSLCKQLFLKYNTFSNVSIEMQLVVCVSMTAMIAKQQNDKRSSVTSFLNTSV